jgi:glycosyltransferase involved in cell wall biosynthesis
VPRVTVVMATYNWATVLPYSIGSALDQTYRDFELLVVGDGCTDESAEVVARIDDPRVQWHNLEPNRGHQYAPNNEGIALARGDVIAYLGHDDLWLPRHLEVLVGAIDEGARLAHGTVLLVEPDEEPARWPGSGWLYERDMWIPPTSLVHDRALALEVGGWRPPWETGTFDPETHLWQRMAGVAGPPRWVGRLTCVKLPAAKRRDVYRDRPHHEQEAWLHRIRSHEDPEATFTATYRESAMGLRSPARRMVNRVRSAVALRTRLRKLGVLPAGPELETAEDRRVANRAFKGLDSPDHRAV